VVSKNRCQLRQFLKFSEEAAQSAGLTPRQHQVAAQNLVERKDGLQDRRNVFVKLTRTGSAMLARLSTAHRAELHQLGPRLIPLLEKLVLDLEPNAGQVDQV
jgi:hypothetical protein